MKRKGKIYKDIVNKDNIKLAILNASKRKKDRKRVKKILDNIDYYTDVIYDLLKDKKYVPSQYIEMKIHDRCKKKRKNYI